LSSLVWNNQTTLALEIPGAFGNDGLERPGPVSGAAVHRRPVALARRDHRRTRISPRIRVASQTLPSRSSTTSWMRDSSSQDATSAGRQNPATTVSNVSPWLEHVEGKMATDRDLCPDPV